MEARFAKVAAFVSAIGRRKGQAMKLYNSFLVRCWVIQGESEKNATEKTVFDIEHIQKGEHQRAISPEDAMQWILTACRNHHPDDPEEETCFQARNL